ncbi:MAG: CBS domain-containing protein [Chloroflexi bacterium]|nr:CBS domain-containing protein [Chloroflexota bacterium]
MTIQAAELRVGNLMTLDPVTVEPDAPIAEAEQLLKTYRVSGLPVVRQREVVGVISQSDIMVARGSELIGPRWDRVQVRHLMTAPPVTVHATATVEWAARLMLRRHIHRLVVLADDGTPVGVVTPLDLLRSLVGDTGDVSA